MKGSTVRARYVYSGVAHVAAWPTMRPFDAITRIWDNMACKKLYITGGISSMRKAKVLGPKLRTA